MTAKEHLQILRARVKSRAELVEEQIESFDDTSLIMSLGAFQMALDLIDEELEAVDARSCTI